MEALGRGSSAPAGPRGGRCSAPGLAFHGQPRSSLEQVEALRQKYGLPPSAAPSSKLRDGSGPSSNATSATSLGLGLGLAGSRSSSTSAIDTIAPLPPRPLGQCSEETNRGSTEHRTCPPVPSIGTIDLSAPLLLRPLSQCSEEANRGFSGNRTSLLAPPTQPSKESRGFAEQLNDSTMLSRIQAFRRDVLGPSSAFSESPRDIQHTSRRQGATQQRGFSAPLAAGRLAPHSASRFFPDHNYWHEAIGAAMSIGGAAVAATVAAAAQHSGGAT